MQRFMRCDDQREAEAIPGAGQMSRWEQEPAMIDDAWPLHVMCTLYYESNEDPQDRCNRELDWPWGP